MGRLDFYIYEEGYYQRVKVDYEFLRRNYCQGSSDLMWCMRCGGREFCNQTALEQHIKSHPAHAYCRTHDREFLNHNNYDAHLRSAAHQLADRKCPGCDKYFTSIANVAGHLESSASCLKNGRHDVLDFVRKVDKHNLITIKTIDLPGYTNTTYEADWHSFNGYGWECFLCKGVYRSLAA